MVEADCDPVPRGNSVLPSRAGPGVPPPRPAEMGRRPQHGDGWWLRLHRLRHGHHRPQAVLEEQVMGSRGIIRSQGMP